MIARSGISTRTHSPAQPVATQSTISSPVFHAMRALTGTGAQTVIGAPGGLRNAVLEDIAAGLSVTEASRLTGLSRVTLHEWLRDENGPPSD